MKNDDKYLMLIEKIGKLLKEYKLCSCLKTQEKIQKDIRLLGNSLSD